MTDPCYVGVGLYPMSLAARLIQLPTGKVRRWAREAESIIHRRFSDKKLLTFLELMELHFISMFREAGVSLQTIRRAAETAAAQFETSYPFAVRRFDTDGRTIFATLKNEVTGKDALEDLKRGQFVFTGVMQPFFKKLDYGSSEIMRYWPLGKGKRVVIDPERNFGHPIDAESGVPTRALYDSVLAEGDESESDVAKWFEVPLAAVRKAIDFERSFAE